MARKTVEPGPGDEIKQRRDRDEITRRIQRDFNVAAKIKPKGLQTDFAGRFFAACGIQQVRVVVDEVPVLP